MTNLKNKKISFTEALNLLKKDEIFSDIYKKLNVIEPSCGKESARIVNQNNREFKEIQFEATFMRAKQLLEVNLSKKEFITLLKTLIYENLNIVELLNKIDKEEKESIERLNKLRKR